MALSKKLINGSGNLDSKLWIIGEAPGEQESLEGKPFIGASGKFLREKFRLCGFDIENSRIENLISWQPPANKFEYIETNCKEELRESVNLLCEKIKAAKPNLVFGLGAKPLFYLLGERTLSNWRGHIFFSEKLNCKVLFTYHPSACLRQFHVDKSQYPGQYAALFQLDCQKVIEEMKTPDLSFPDVKFLVQPSFTETINELERLLDEKKPVSYDIETLGGFFMDCIGLCNNLSFSTCIPFYIPNSPRETIPYWKSMDEAVQVLRRIKQLLESSIPKVAQNSQYDNLILGEYYGIDVRNCCHDTMVMAHDIYSSLPKDLGALISVFTKLPYHKFLIHTGKVIDRWNYNAADALANLHIMEGETLDSKELGIYEHYYIIPHQVLKPCNIMERTGVNVNVEFRDAAIERERLLIDSIMDSLDKIFPLKINTDKKYPHKVNPGSGKDKMKVFSTFFKCRLHYKKGSITMDGDTLKKYETDKRSYVSILAKAFRLYLYSRSMKTTLETPLRKGRLHTAYGVGGIDQNEEEESGTDTGRLNSKESILGGRNLQNLKKGQQRQMLIPG
jgi:uracil-DNA glycosylase family 4